MTFWIRRPSNALSFLWLATIVAALPDVAGAAPSITAVPSEVTFYVKSPTLQKSTNITWDADGASDSPRAVYYTTNGANETLFENGGQDSKPAAFIKLNNTYEFCLWGDNHQQKIKCVAVTTKLKEVNLKFGFIHDVKVEPCGQSVRISFTTERPSLPVVQISVVAPNKVPLISENDVAAFDATDPVTSQLAGGGLTHGTPFSNLTLDTDHFFVITAADKKTGLVFKVKGKFHTLQRTVSVTFEKIKIVDDSDDLSPGDLVFGFFINGKNAPNGKPMTFGTHASTDSTKTANIKGSIADAPQTITLKVVGYDDDETEWIPLGPFVVLLATSCGTNAVDPGSSEGQNECGEWTSGSKSFDLASAAQNVPNPEAFTLPFTIQARPQGDDSEVAFDVTGKLSAVSCLKF